MRPETRTAYTVPVDDHQLEENGKSEARLEENGCSKTCAEKEYEPHDYGNVAHPIGYCGAVVHLVRGTVGTGILVLPFAFREVGYGVGIIGVAVVGLLYVNNLHALLFTEYELCKKLKVRNLTFIGVVRNSFEHGPKATRKFGPFFKCLLYVYYGVPSGCAVYLIIIADNLRHILHYFVGAAGGPHHTIAFCISVATAPILLLCMIPKLKYLVPLSVVTNVFTVLNIGIILAYSCDVAAWSKNAEFARDIKNAPKFFAWVLQSLIATGMVLPLKNDMGEPKRFGGPCGVLNASFLSLTILYGLFGLMGYLNYGEAVKDNILSNLPAGQLVTISVYIFYTLALFVTYTLLFYVYYDTIWSNFLRERVSKTKFAKISGYSLRILVNVAAYLMAIAVPNFSLFTSIIGTIGIIIEIGLPSLLQLLVVCEIKVKRSIFRYCLMKNCFIIIISLIMFSMSCKSCFYDVIRLYNAS